MRALALVLVFLLPLPLAAQTLEELMQRLPEGSYSDRSEVVVAIGATGDTRAAAVLETLGEGELHQSKADGAVVRVIGRGA